jgi:RNA polymerase sigma-70 factor, ECF subfamily
MSSALERSHSTETFAQGLVLARNNGEPTVWELLAACRGYLLQVATRRLNPVLRAKANPSDLVQDTLLEAYRDFAQFRGRCEAEWLAWLRQLLVHNIANFERRFLATAMRRTQLEISLGERNVSDVVVAQDPSPSSTLVAKEQKHAVERQLEQLPEDYRLVLVWHHKDELPFDEIGRRLCRSPDAARRLWSRAIDRLQQLINCHEQSTI